MGFLSGWFTRKPEDYEQVLAVLAVDISKRQQRLSEIRLREKRQTLLLSVCTLSIWVAYVSLWYMDAIPDLMNDHPRNTMLQKGLKGVPVFVGPIIILFMRRIMQIWYTRLENAEEKILVKLRKQQRETVEEIKKQTNYYSTRSLLEKYDEGTAPDSPLRKRFPPQSPAQPITPVPVTPQRPLQPQSQGPSPSTLKTPVQQPQGRQQQWSPSPQRPMPPPRKQWYDKLADAILGDDDASSPSAAASRYALICQKCFAHNGLVKESVWEDTQYVCPKCGYFNPSARTIRELRQKRGSASPSSRVPPSAFATAAPATNGSAPPVGMEPKVQDHPVESSDSRKPGGSPGSSPSRQEDEDDAAVESNASIRMDVDS